MIFNCFWFIDVALIFVQRNSFINKTLLTQYLNGPKFFLMFEIRNQLTFDDAVNEQSLNA